MTCFGLNIITVPWSNWTFVARKARDLSVYFSSREELSYILSCHAHSGNDCIACSKRTYYKWRFIYSIRIFPSRSTILYFLYFIWNLVILKRMRWAQPWYTTELVRSSMTSITFWKKFCGKKLTSCPHPPTMLSTKRPTGITLRGDNAGDNECNGLVWRTE